jgi:hypothetical protein
MASPKVFIASTCYDLKYIRSNLKYFIESLGYEPVLSEYGQVFYGPEEHTHDSCLNEIENCQLFILLIGGRFGGKFKDSDKSITNKEYEKAIDRKIPIFTLIEQDVYSEHHVYIKNVNNPNIENINFPSVDSKKIFEFIDMVRKQSINNAIHPFSNFNDIENYIKKQLAGLFYTYLTNQNEEKRVFDIIEQILKVNDKVEFLSAQLLKATGSTEAKIIVELYNKMINDPSIKTLLNTGHKLDPIQVLLSKDYLDCSMRLGKKLIVKKEPGFSSSSTGEISEMHFKESENKFSVLKNDINSILKNKNITLENLIEHMNN